MRKIKSVFGLVLALAVVAAFSGFSVFASENPAVCLDCKKLDDGSNVKDKCLGSKDPACKNEEKVEGSKSASVGGKSNAAKKKTKKK